MLTFESSQKYGVYDLQNLVRLLRSEGGCPWDREQTHESIRRNLLEEAYEAAEAIDEADALHLREELGDVLTQVVFHAELEDERGAFDLDGVADAVVRKLLYRHPHVFGDVTAATSDEVLENWEELKRREKAQLTVTDAMQAVARSLPALWRAEKIQKKAADAGYGVTDASGAEAQMRAAANSLARAETADDGVFDALGDALFAAVNAARVLRVDPEAALTAASERFIARFGRIERAAAARGLKIAELTPAAADALYTEAQNAL
jgi:tetrapyrrole methylase family protein/MazG family protein